MFRGYLYKNKFMLQTGNGNKRKPRNQIKFQVTLNEEQKVAKAIILENKITVLKGGAGSGKSTTGCNSRRRVRIYARR